MSTIRRILCVDDEADIRTVLAAALKHSLGAEVHAVGSGQEALDYLADAEPPDVIILDGMMPGMDGFETCRALRQDPRLAGVTVVFLTAGADSESAARDAGASAVLAKPFDPMSVGAQIRAVVESA